MPQAARDHIRTKLAAHWTPERRQHASEQLRQWHGRKPRKTSTGKEKRT